MLLLQDKSYPSSSARSVGLSRCHAILAATAGSVTAVCMVTGIAPAVGAILVSTLCIAILSVFDRSPSAAIESEVKALPLHIHDKTFENIRLLEGVPIPLLLLDGNLSIKFANNAIQDLCGSVELGVPLASVIRARALVDAVASVAASGMPASVEFAHMRSRERRTLRAYLRPVDDGTPGAAGTAFGLMIAIEDRTRLSMVEQKLRDFIANASHEMKTPLASIAGFIETLQGAARNDLKATERFLPIMAQQAERMKRLIEDLLSLNRIEMNAFVRPEGAVSLTSLLRESADFLSPLADLSRVRIEIDLPPGALTVSGDRAELSQVFVNLIDNAIKHGGSGGVVQIKKAAPEAGRGRMIGISVIDRGPGIVREHIPRLTERFYRAPASRGKTVEGTGLGLSIVKHILNRHRGDLTIRSTRGAGATFTAWLQLSVENNVTTDERATSAPAAVPTQTLDKTAT